MIAACSRVAPGREGDEALGPKVGEADGRSPGERVVAADEEHRALAVDELGADRARPVLVAALVGGREHPPRRGSSASPPA
jgi:hypothetical protein